MIPGGARILLTADDFGLDDCVSAGIAELAANGRLSAASALVNMPGWPRTLRQIPDLRRRVALGLHLNLTTGNPLGQLAAHTQGAALPPVDYWIRQALSGAIDEFAIGAEFEQQIDRFEAIVGAPPDFIDGHHHVHVLPGIRRALARIIRHRFPSAGILVRDPSDRVLRIAARGASVRKALFVTWLARGFARLMSAAGAITNRGFSGFSNFDRKTPYITELHRSLVTPGDFHILMCHPGLTGASGCTLQHDDERREEEFRAISQSAGLLKQLLQPASSRSAAGSIDWRQIAHG